MPGVAIAMATDRPGGFRPRTGQLRRTAAGAGPRQLPLHAGRVSTEILGVYLGGRTARRVLAGEVRRGTGRAIEAAILLADLRGFTSLASRAPAARVVDMAGRAS